MHKGSLAINHASGFLTRSRNRKVTDSFPECVEFRNLVRSMAHYICDNKAKDRFKRYSDVVKKKHGYECIVLPIPNKTRTNGVFLMYEAVLRSYRAIQSYSLLSSDTDFRNVYLTRDKWIQLAEYTAVYYPVKKFLTTIQTDEFGANSLTRIQLGVMLESLYSPDSGDNIFDLNYETMSLQVVDTVSDMMWSPGTSYDDLPKVTHAFSHMWRGYDGDKWDAIVTNDTKTLVTRVFQECKTYFGDASEDEDLSILFNPVTMVAGLSYLCDFLLVSESSVRAMEEKLVDRVCMYYNSRGDEVNCESPPDGEEASKRDSVKKSKKRSARSDPFMNRLNKRAKTDADRGSGSDTIDGSTVVAGNKSMSKHDIDLRMRVRKEFASYKKILQVSATTTGCLYCESSQQTL